jgi:hypothetical protein
MSSHDPFAALVAQGQRKIAAATPQPAAGPLVGTVLPPAPSGVHGAVLGALDEVLTLVTAGAGQLPSSARLMLGTIRSLRPMMEEGVNRMPEAQLRGMLQALRDRIDAALSPDA